MAGFQHLSVMPEEVLRFLSPRPGGCYLDGTLGGGGHAALVAERCAPGGGTLIGMDRDLEALKAAAERLSRFGDAVRLLHGNFADIATRLDSLGVDALDGFVLDLGVSSHQLDTARRGFSFQQEGALDMRMDGDSGETAADLVNRLPEHELERIIREYGEERWAKRIASFIVRARSEAPIENTLRLVDIIKGAIPKAKWEERLHPATRTFQALRIAVNHELESLERGLKSAIDRLKPGGRGVVISFHSLEDRIVKHVFREYAAGCTCPRNLPVCVCGRQPRVRVLTGRPVTATEEELRDNPRSRSAKLRAVEKL
ncbi:16S rRNA (cytosine(1402)-N(4))-methyltransferase RsmH [Pelobacter propionicus]|uniref:Ribosomal RNA small subunit methyltransferase H n=1 Tax=Pelobacter propionicus (strain DSM 2379 / NBRC 103807 / OttBd1) TaxID=338966 RepID=RSMH_PELPD|nr:16S rRNA (cytosine(1402)-N(4))-methyltransferase RsmH [Pelobacter propionicus]A1AU69.1 RecName: Full=Ribosomal RNA small subunit methyltransferase H; AltName: Full=16S rRNA m(4)C1402 methyltransferase; AltName: Full=rRNA (cytosine-N(4)-)-methyltransferase RsmH [Pelobacter propionicus DSM 2379]ABL00890.1 S-adenosyl-methyltransferase MraW [Pelobacter propionicus DSM 2379]